MSDLEKFSQLMKTQSELLKKVSLGPVENLAKMSEQFRSNNFDQLKGLNPFSKLSRDIATNFAPNNLGLGHSITEALKSMDLASRFALPAGLEYSLLKAARQNLAINQSLTSAFQAQLGLANSLAEAARSIASPMNQFNVLNAAIQRISFDYLDKIVRDSRLDDLEVAEDVSNKIMDIVDNVEIVKTSHVSANDLVELRNSIVSELTPLIQQTKSEKARLFIIDLLTIICFVLALYDLHSAREDITNREVINITSNQMDQLRKDIKLSLEQSSDTLKRTRIALTKVNLRYSNSKNSQVLGVVNEGQQVLVIEIRHKWLLVTYLDDNSKKPMSGFVYKKYFKPEN